MTKEPKLVRARQIPEWDTYDREIAAFAARLDSESDAGVMARGVDDLAAEGKKGGSAAVDPTSGGGESAQDPAIADIKLDDEEGRRIGDEL